MFNIGEGFSYATVWQPEVDGKRVKANLTTSKKLKEENAEGKLFENSNWKAVFVGKAFEDACDLQEKDRIKIIRNTGKWKSCTKEESWWNRPERFRAGI